MIKTVIAIAAFMVINSSILANEGNNAKINWMTIEEAEKKVLQEPRKIFVDVYTDWCGWCKRMEANTFSHPYIIEYINENFYAVKLNAEQEEPITFRGVEYVNENPGERRATHNFARALLQGRMSYPSVAFFDEELNLITAIPGYREPRDFEPILVFFNDDVFIHQPNLDEFISNFEGNIIK